MTTTAQWIAAWGTAGGAVATVVTVLLAFLGLRRELRRANEQRVLDAAERERDREDRFERDIGQARLLLISVEATAPLPEWGLEDPAGLYGDVRVWVHNHSSAPILFARPHEVVLSVVSGELGLPNVPDVEPGNRFDLDPDQELERGPIPAGGARHWDVIVSTHDPGGGWVRHVVAETDRYVATVAYSDAAGLRWLRTGDEQPRPDRRPNPFGAT